MKPTRQLSPTGTYFVTANTAGKRHLFLTERFAQLFVTVLYEYRRQGRYQLHAFVLMPDHFHLLLTPALGVTLERAMQYLKGGYSFRVRKELLFPGEIWERGFTDHRIRDLSDFTQHTTYIDGNPVRRGLVFAPGDFAYSSANGRFELDAWPPAAKAAAAMVADRHG